MILKVIQFVYVVLLLTGCTSQMVNRPGSSTTSAYAPVNELSRPGVVKYLNQGSKGVISARREDAYKKMASACSGPYEIVSEGPSQEGGTATNISGTLYWNNSQYWNIEFRCLPANESFTSGFIAKPWVSKIDSTSTLFREVIIEETEHTDDHPLVQLLSPILVDLDFISGRVKLVGVVQNNADKVIDGILVSFYAVDKYGKQLTESTSYVGSVDTGATKKISTVLMGINDIANKSTYAYKIEFAILYENNEPILGYINLL